MSVSAEPGRDARTLGLGALLVLLVACLPSLGTLDAPWIAEDALLLGQAHAESPWIDWNRSQGGMEIVRFWRPVVSASWDLQEAWTGIAPVPLRLCNLALHALASVLALGVAWRAGAGSLGAALAGAWVASFPEQGGTSTWLAGRTDLLAAVGLLASAWTALGPRPLLSAPLAFLACASKEFGFLAGPWIAGLALLRGERGRGLWVRTGPALGASLVALLWRTHVLGGIGGYSGVPAGPAGLLGAARALLDAAGWTWGPLALAILLLSPRQGRSERRAAIGALALALGSTALLFDLLAGGTLAPQNRRLLYVPECALALGAGFLVSGSGRTARARTLTVGVLGLIAARTVLAWNDTHEWAGAAWRGEEAIARARATLAAEPPSDRPVFFADFPGSLGGAYCLGFGAAARFRAPFPASPRPAWPWRLLFVAHPARERRALVAARADGSLWPLDDPRAVPALELNSAEGARLWLDERVLPAAEDRSPRWSVAGGPAGARLEAVLVSEHGYEPIPLGALDDAGGARGTLRQLLQCSNGVATAGDVLRQVADLGSTRAFLELRALGADDAVRAASAWVALEWSPELRAASR